MEQLRSQRIFKPFLCVVLSPEAIYTLILPPDGFTAGGGCCPLCG
jgi:hypothetical protein